MLDHLDQPEAARTLEKAFCDVAGGLNGAKQVRQQCIVLNAVFHMTSSKKTEKNRPDIRIVHMGAF